jgi:hypothetical protein
MAIKEEENSNSGSEGNLKILMTMKGAIQILIALREFTQNRYRDRLTKLQTKP